MTRIPCLAAEDMTTKFMRNAVRILVKKAFTGWGDFPVWD